jgi:hypothetical protein
VNAYTEMRYWSPSHGANVVRLGAWGNDGRERHAFVNADQGGKAFREARSKALDALEVACDGGESGEVKPQE